GHLAGLAVELGAVGHEDAQPPGHLVLEVRRLAPLRARRRLDVLAPAPAGLEGQPADLGAGDAHQVEAATFEGPGLVRGAEVTQLRLCHSWFLRRGWPVAAIVDVLPCNPPAAHRPPRCSRPANRPATLGPS